MMSQGASYWVISGGLWLAIRGSAFRIFMARFLVDLNRAVGLVWQPYLHAFRAEAMVGGLPRAFR